MSSQLFLAGIRLLLYKEKIMQHLNSAPQYEFVSNYTVHSKYALCSHNIQIETALNRSEYVFRKRQAFETRFNTSRSSSPYSTLCNTRCAITVN